MIFIYLFTFFKETVLSKKRVLSLSLFERATSQKESIDQYFPCYWSRKIKLLVLVNPGQYEILNKCNLSCI